MLHLVVHPPQNASDNVKQIVGLAGHSASPRWTALVLNVSLSTTRLQTYVGLKAILRASCSEQENQFFLNSPKIRRWLGRGPDMENQGGHPYT